MSKDSNNKDKGSLNVNRKSFEAVKSTYDLYTSDSSDIQKDDFSNSKPKEKKVKKTEEKPKKNEPITEKKEFNKAHNKFKESISKAKEKNDKVSAGTKSSLKPKLQKSLLKVQQSVAKEKIDKLKNISAESKNKIFAVGESSGPGKDKMSEKDKKVMIETMDSWKVSKDIEDANTSIVVSWQDKIAKK